MICFLCTEYVQPSEAETDQAPETRHKLEWSQFPDLWCKKYNRTDSELKMNSFYDSDADVVTKDKSKPAQWATQRENQLSRSWKGGKCLGQLFLIPSTDRRQVIFNSVHHPYSVRHRHPAIHR